MAVNWLHKLAARGSVPVFPVLGKQGDSALRHLALSPQIELVDSPRHASVLLVAVVVPAEYGKDPTAIGTMLGFTEMGEIKHHFKAGVKAQTGIEF